MHLLTHVSQFLLPCTKNKIKKSLNWQGEENVQQKAYVQGIILPQGGKVLHGQCPCVRDKFHV